MDNEKRAIKNGSIWSKNYILITMAQALLSMPIYMVGNTLSAYLTGGGMAASLAGTIVSLFFICSMIMRPFTGVGANRMNKKYFLLLASGVFIIGSLVAIVFDAIWAVVLSRFLYGVSWSVCTTTAMAYVADITPRNQLGEAIGFFGITQIIASAIAPSLALAVYSSYGYRMMILVAMAIQAVALICLAVMDTPSKSVEENTEASRFSLSDIISKEALIPAVVALLFVLINNVLNTFLVNYGEEQGIEGISVYFVITSVSMFVVRMLTSKLVDKCRYALAILPCGICMIVALLSLYFLRSFSGVVISAVFFGCSYGALLPFTQTACIKSCPSNKSGTGSSTYMLGTDVGSVLGGVLGGFVAGAVGYANMYIIFIVPAIIGIGVAFLYKENRIEEKQ